MKSLRSFVIQSLRKLWNNPEVSVKSDPSRTQDDVVATSPVVATNPHVFLNPSDFVDANEHITPITKISTKESWNSEVVPHERVVMLCFATWSSPDMMFIRILTHLVPEFEDIKFLKADVDEICGEENQVIVNLAGSWPIYTTPTIVLLKYGEKADISMGYRGKEELRTILKNWSEL